MIGKKSIDERQLEFPKSRKDGALLSELEALQAGSRQSLQKRHHHPFSLSEEAFTTLFITVLFLPQVTENLQYQWVIRNQAAPDEAEVVLIHISDLLCLDAHVTACHSSMSQHGGGIQSGKFIGGP
ncbi:MAG: hypothetical protein JRH06_03020 [Deltaproteobacteria bacterium]|nr:hypothetical protein [Deltaproteobacteria bacterium]